MASTTDKEIKYINKDYTDFKTQLLNFAKVYYPNSYNDFNEGSVGMMNIEMASYVGDVLSFYTDNQLKEIMLPYAEETKNVIALSQFIGGYKPVLSSISTTFLDVYQIIPATGDYNELPDYNYALKIENLEVSAESDSTIIFRANEDVDFSISNDINPTDISIYQTDDNNTPLFYLLKKSVKATSGKKVTFEYTFGSPEAYSKITLPDDNIVEIVNVVDSDGNYWYEVPYLSAETILQETLNTEEYDQELSKYKDDVPYLLKVKKVPRRFITRINSENKYELHFGAGTTDTSEDILLPSQLNIKSNNIVSNLNLNFLDPINFLRTKTYGLTPSNTTITVTYVIGDGNVNLNVAQGDLKIINNISFRNDEKEYGDSSSDAVKLLRMCKNSVGVINSEAATGGSDKESVDEIKNNALSNYAAQNRSVTKGDYIIRTLSMPSKFGRIAKAYVAKDYQYDLTTDSNLYNPNSINLYCLGYNSDKKLISLNTAIKENLKIYLTDQRMLTDTINLLDAYIINIGINFEIYVKNNYNKKVVLYNAIQALKDYFDIDKWQINQPIILSEVYNAIENADGVKFCPSVTIECKYNGDYSECFYDIANATKDEIIYPSIDASIFELKFPTKDIIGTAK